MMDRRATSGVGRDMRIHISLTGEDRLTLIEHSVEITSEHDLREVFEAIRAETQRLDLFPVRTGNLAIKVKSEALLAAVKTVREVLHVGLKEAADVVRGMGPLRVTSNDVERLNEVFKSNRYDAEASLVLDAPKVGEER